MTLYHFTNSKIRSFKEVLPQRGYSQASGLGIYFTPDYEKGLMKYGKTAQYCYTCEYTGEVRSVLNLGEYDAMYYTGEKVHSAGIYVANFKRGFAGVPEVKEPEIRLEHMSVQAKRWLLEQGYTAVSGMDYWGYACPEFCVLDAKKVCIVCVEEL